VPVEKKSFTLELAERASEDLTGGKVDWWEQPPLDFIPKIEQTPNLQTQLNDPLGTTSDWRSKNEARRICL
jgi:hypothetical protein